LGANLKIWKLILLSMEYPLIGILTIYALNIHNNSNSEISAMSIIFVLLVYYIIYVVMSIINIYKILKVEINEDLTKKLNEKYQEVQGKIRVIKDNKFTAYTIHSFINDIIVISENLVKELSEDMIDVIIYHEIGHIYYRHFERRFLMNFLFATIVTNIIIYFNIDYAILVSIILKYLYIHIIKQHELEADMYAVMKTQKPEVLKFVLLLSVQDKSSLFYEHPILSKRIENINKIIDMIDKNSSPSLLKDETIKRN